MRKDGGDRDAPKPEKERRPAEPARTPIRGSGGSFGAALHDAMKWR